MRYSNVRRCGYGRSQYQEEGNLQPAYPSTSKAAPEYVCDRAIDRVEVARSLEKVPDIWSNAYMWKTRFFPSNGDSELVSSLKIFKEERRESEDCWIICCYFKLFQN